MPIARLEFLRYSASIHLCFELFSYREKWAFRHCIWESFWPQPFYFTIWSFLLAQFTYFQATVTGGIVAYFPQARWCLDCSIIYLANLFWMLPNKALLEVWRTKNKFSLSMSSMIIRVLSPKYFDNQITCSIFIDIKLLSPSQSDHIPNRNPSSLIFTIDALSFVSRYVNCVRLCEWKQVFGTWDSTWLMRREDER